MTPKPTGELLTSAEAARRLDVSLRSVEHFREEGCPRERDAQRRWRYPWPALLHWYIARVEDKARGRAEPASLEDAKQRRTEADARLMELQLAEREGSMVTVGDWERHLDDLLQRLRAKIVTMPTRLAHRLTGATQAEIQTRLDEAANEMLEELCRTGEEAEADDEPPSLVESAA